MVGTGCPVLEAWPGWRALYSLTCRSSFCFLYQRYCLLISRSSLVIIYHHLFRSRTRVPLPSLLRCVFIVLSLYLFLIVIFIVWRPSYGCFYFVNIINSHAYHIFVFLSCLKLLYCFLYGGWGVLCHKAGPHLSVVRKYTDSVAGIWHLQFTAGSEWLRFW